MPTIPVKGFNPYEKAIFSAQRSLVAPPTAPVRAPQTAPSSEFMRAFGTDTYTRDAGQTHIEAHNVSYKVFNHLDIKVPYASLSLTDRTPENPLHLEGLDFNLHLNAAQVQVTDKDVNATITALLAQQGKKLPVKSAQVSFNDNNQIRIAAKVKALGMGLPVEATGQIQATASGQVRFDLQKVKFLGLPMTGLMNTLGLNLDKVLKLRDPEKGYYTQGNSVFVNPNKIMEKPGLSLGLQRITTHQGTLTVTAGNSLSDVAYVDNVVNTPRANAISIAGGHFYYDGYFVKDGVVRMEDKTAATPLQLEKDGETFLHLEEGFVGITAPKFAEILKGKLGNGGSLKNVATTLESNAARVYGDMFNTIPISLDLEFSNTADGALMFTPKNAKAMAAIPLPDKLIKDQVRKMVDGGVPYGDGVSLPDLGDIKLGKLRQVKHQEGYLILQAGN